MHVELMKKEKQKKINKINEFLMRKTGEKGIRNATLLIPSEKKREMNLRFGVRGTKSVQQRTKRNKFGSTEYYTQDPKKTYFETHRSRNLT